MTREESWDEYVENRLKDKTALNPEITRRVLLDEKKSNWAEILDTIIESLSEEEKVMSGMVLKGAISFHRQKPHEKSVVGSVVDPVVAKYYVLGRVLRTKDIYPDYDVFSMAKLDIMCACANYSKEEETTVFWSEVFDNIEQGAMEKINNKEATLQL